MIYVTVRHLTGARDAFGDLVCVKVSNVIGLSTTILCPRLVLVFIKRQFLVFCVAAPIIAYSSDDIFAVCLFSIVYCAVLSARSHIRRNMFELALFTVINRDTRYVSILPRNNLSVVVILSHFLISILYFVTMWNLIRNQNGAVSLPRLSRHSNFALYRLSYHQWFEMRSNTATNSARSQ